MCCHDQFVEFLPIDTALTELVREITDRREFIEGIFAEQSVCVCVCVSTYTYTCVCALMCMYVYMCTHI